MPPRNVALVEAQRLPLRQPLRRRVRHAVVEAGQLDAALRIVQPAQDAGQRVDRVQRRAAEQAGMQVALRGVQRQLHIHHAAQPGGDGGGVDVPHAGVADDRDVGGQRVPVLGQERLEVEAAHLLLALDQHRHGAGRAARCLVPGAQGFQPHHHLALVVHRAAGGDAWARAGPRSSPGSNGGVVHSSSGSAGCTS